MTTTQITLISSQRYLDDDTVSEKRAARDYSVSVYRVTLDGSEYAVIVDGHHSLAAAKADGVEPKLVSVDAAIASQYDYEIENNGTEQWLTDHRVDSDYYDARTGQAIW